MLRNNETAYQHLFLLMPVFIRADVGCDVGFDEAHGAVFARLAPKVNRQLEKDAAKGGYIAARRR